MRFNRKSFLVRHGFAVVSVAVAIGLRRLLDPWLGDAFPFATLFFAIMVTAWFGGLKPALTAVFLGAITADYFLLRPRGSFSLAVTEEFGLLLYLATGFGIAGLGGLMHRARARAETSAAALRAANDQLERRVQERTDELLQRTRTLEAEVAERARSEAQLLGSLKEISDLKTALDEHALVAITDPQGKITYANDKFCAVSKYLCEE